MPTPLGENEYNSLAVPLYGEAQIRQVNSSNTILTLDHSSAGNTGRFLIGRDQVSSYTTVGGGSSEYEDLVANSSVMAGVAVFDIDAEGGYRALQGTSVGMELNSTFIGGRGGTSLAEWSIDSTGRFIGIKQTVTTLTTAGSTVLQSSQSGTLFNVGRGDGTSIKIILPNGAPVGTWYDFWLTSQDVVGDVVITSTVGGASIIMLGAVSSVASTADAIEPLSTLPTGINLKLIASTVWLARGLGLNMSSADSTAYTAADLLRSAWTTASTA